MEGFAKTSIAQQRLSTPEELAAGVAFLASDDSVLMVGQTLVIDGGMIYH